MTDRALHHYLLGFTPHALAAGEAPTHEVVQKAFTHYCSTGSWDVDVLAQGCAEDVWLKFKQELPKFARQHGFRPWVFVDVPEYTPNDHGDVEWRQPTSEYMALYPTAAKNMHKEDMFHFSAHFSHYLHTLTGAANEEVVTTLKEYAAFGLHLNLDSHGLERDKKLAEFIFKLLAWFAREIAQGDLIIYDEAGSLNPFFYYSVSENTWRYQYDTPYYSLHKTEGTA